MKLTDYYRFERVSMVTKCRMVCVASTKNYDRFEEKRADKHMKPAKGRDETKQGDLVCYLGDADKIKANNRRKADKRIGIKGEHISSVYWPDPEKPYAYGDVKGTSDAMLMIFHDMEIVNGAISEGAVMEIFIARGQSHNVKVLYQQLCDGDLDDELDVLRNQAG